MTREEMQQIIAAIVKMRDTAADEVAVKAKSLYPGFDKLCRDGYTAKDAGVRFVCGGKLYKTTQPNTKFLSHFPPGDGTESLYTIIDETHAGTQEDPIPYDGNMTLENGLYYVQSGAVYLCIRDTVNPVYHALSELVGLYVQKT